MEATIREVPLRQPVHLEAYRSLGGLGAEIDLIKHMGRAVRRRLGSRRLFMLNSTEKGGGVAEMLPRLCCLLQDVGVSAHWLVLQPGDPDFFRVTKSLHNLLHGEPGSFDLARGRAVYEAVSQSAADGLRRLVGHDDLLVVHDPQPLGAAALLRAEHRPTLIWRCHVGLPFSTEETAAAWDFLRPYLEPFSRLLFSVESYIPDEHLDRSEVAHPGVDPLSHKNRELRPYKLIGILRAAGLVEGPPLPEWTRFREPALLFDGEKWSARPIPLLLHCPVVLQVSRFDRLKGFQFLIPAFEHLLRSFPDRVAHLRADTERVMVELGHVQLVLAGPDPSGVADDPEGAEVLEALCLQHRALPRKVASRVHLLRLPMADLKQNALTVNALQRVASVVVQDSVKEGFGLTVAEALWKGAPVVAANVGGIGLQIRHQTDGYLVGDPTDPAAVAEGLLQTLAFPKQAEAMACSGRVRMRELFLVTNQVKRWLEVLHAATPEPPVLHPPAAFT